MPLFNPPTVSVQNTVTTDPIKLTFKQETNVTNSSGGVPTASASSPDRALVVITNNSSAPVYLGYVQSGLSASNYAIKLQPEGTYESPLGFTGDIYCSLSSSQTIKVTEFEYA